MTRSMNPTIKISPTADEFIRDGTETMATYIRSAIAERKRCILGLSGGNTPRRKLKKVSARIVISHGA